MDKFRAYSSFAESIVDHSSFLKSNPRYSELFNSTDTKEWANGLQKAGYATDPDYASKIIAIMKGRGIL